MFGRKAKLIEDLMSDLKLAEAEIEGLAEDNDILNEENDELHEIIRECLSQGRFSKGFQDKVKERIQQLKIRLDK